MKKLILTAGALVCAASVFAQGTVIFNNSVAGQVIARVYRGATVQVGNGTADFPAGSTVWTGFTALTGSGWGAVILAANGLNQPADSLTMGATPNVGTFRGGIGAGILAGQTATIPVPKDSAGATLQLFVWDRVAGGTDPIAALAAYRLAIQQGRGAADFYAGLSGTFNVANIGGDVNTPPALTGLQSFSIVPEPSSMALAGLAAASLLIFRRRK